MKRLSVVLRWTLFGLLILALFGTWLLPWERWPSTPRTVWIAALIITGFAVILLDEAERAKKTPPPPGWPRRWD